MVPFILRRLVQLIPTFLLATLVAFVIIQLAPGDFLSQLKENPRATAVQIQQLTTLYGLDRPGWQQYFQWLFNLLRGDLGLSFQYNQPVLQLIKGPALNSLILVGISVVISFAVAIPVGVYGALRPYSFGDRFSSFLAYFGLGIPSFFFALLAIYALLVTQQTTGWDMPIGGKTSGSLPADISAGRHAWDIFVHALVPSIILVLRSISSDSRVIRGQMLETMGQDYIRTARAKGLGDRQVTYKHALKIALLPIIASIGGFLPALIGGAGFVEVVFSWPGLTPMLLSAFFNNDLYVLMSTLAVSTLLYIIGNLLSDLLLAAVDPRIRYT
ncbi:ABC transporter permease [Deinococcus sp.]|uniref:ABC transporter permease n=1 Tax=Deinococcus sp. TaxID=47478 RepID=UPI0025E1F05D|nr:ABC transporter permease [Deinococcus sp.]